MKTVLFVGMTFTAISFTVLAIWFVGTLPAIAQQSGNVNVRVTGQFSISRINFVRFVDNDTKAVCYMSDTAGAISCFKP